MGDLLDGFDFVVEEEEASQAAELDALDVLEGELALVVWFQKMY